jgi:hypothetical protein
VVINEIINWRKGQVCKEMTLNFISVILAPQNSRPSTMYSEIRADQVSTGRGVVLPARGLECACVFIGSRSISG